MMRGICPRDCPQRRPGCQNAETCETWRQFEAAKQAENEQRKKYNAEVLDYQEARQFKTRRFQRSRNGGRA